MNDINVIIFTVFESRLQVDRDSGVFSKVFSNSFLWRTEKKIIDHEKLSFSKYFYGVQVLIIEIFSKGNGRTIRKFLSTIFNKFRIGC